MKDAVLTQINKACEQPDINKILALAKQYNMPYLGMFLSTTIRRQKIGIKLDPEDGLIKYYNYFHNTIVSSQNDDTEINPVEMDDVSPPTNKSTLPAVMTPPSALPKITSTTKSSLSTIDEEIRIQLLCNWTEDLRSSWCQMIPFGSRIVLVDKDPDYWVIINKPLNDSVVYDPKKTIIFQMEPLMEKQPEKWGEWSNPNPNKFLKVFTHCNSYNNVEWHLKFDAGYSSFTTIEKDPRLENTLSTVLSDKYYDPGHIKRIDFVKCVENMISIDVYGNNMFLYKSYKGPLPHGIKNDGLMPYKYHFNAENHSIPNYFSEKIVDAILSECLCFYWGCPNISDYIDSRAYIVLDLDDLFGSLQIIKDAIENDEWSKRIDIIRAEKKKLLTDMNFFTRIEQIIS
jgi:hypothetical protein